MRTFSSRVPFALALCAGFFCGLSPVMPPAYGMDLTESLENETFFEEPRTILGPGAPSPLAPRTEAFSRPQSDSPTVNVIPLDEPAPLAFVLPEPPPEEKAPHDPEASFTPSLSAQDIEGQDYGHSPDSPPAPAPAPLSSVSAQNPDFQPEDFQIEETIEWHGTRAALAPEAAQDFAHLAPIPANPLPAETAQDSQKDSGSRSASAPILSDIAPSTGTHTAPKQAVARQAAPKDLKPVKPVKTDPACPYQTWIGAPVDMSALKATGRPYRVLMAARPIPHVDVPSAMLDVFISPAGRVSDVYCH